MHSTFSHILYSSLLWATTGNRLLELMELCSGPLQPFSWDKKITELLACNLSSSNNQLLAAHTLRNVLIITSCLSSQQQGKKGLGGKRIKAVDNVVLTWVKKLLPWKCAALERHECPAPARTALGRGIQCVWNESNIRLHTKENATIQLSLLFCLPEKTGQFIAVMASGLVNPCNASESWLAQKGMMRSPQLRSQSVAKSSSALQKI